MQLRSLFKKQAKGEKIAGLTAYDACFARIFAAAGCDFLLIGDSLGMVVQGRANTLGVSVDDIAYHLRCCSAGASDILLIADLPFGSFETSPQQTFATASGLLAQGAGMVKIEGGAAYAQTVSYLVERGVPVCAHVGLLPQASLITGFRVQGKDEESAARIIADAQALSEAGASMMVLEMIPAALAAKITEQLAGKTITIGIGAGRDCDGQIMVMHDLLGLFPKPPKFARNFLADANSVDEAVRMYVAQVADGSFPRNENIPE